MKKRKIGAFFFFLCMPPRVFCRSSCFALASANTSLPQRGRRGKKERGKEEEGEKRGKKEGREKKRGKEKKGEKEGKGREEEGKEISRMPKIGWIDSARN